MVVLVFRYMMDSGGKNNMKKWVVTLKALVHKTYEVEGEDADIAFERAEEEFRREFNDEMFIRNVDDLSIEESVSESE